ncbi:hypothetical protein M2480_002999 [Parabacteroides sp. PFB2-12]|nr:hypothetical protein [Parabacteroides sp. PM6-13]MDH6391995.1 hypothetical protein [Parabacteroides sp. PFB2-12]
MHSLSLLNAVLGFQYLDENKLKLFMPCLQKRLM